MSGERSPTSTPRRKASGLNSRAPPRAAPKGVGDVVGSSWWRRGASPEGPVQRHPPGGLGGSPPRGTGGAGGPPRGKRKKEKGGREEVPPSSGTSRYPRGFVGKGRQAPNRWQGHFGFKAFVDKPVRNPRGFVGRGRQAPTDTNGPNWDRIRFRQTRSEPTRIRGLGPAGAL